LHAMNGLVLKVDLVKARMQDAPTTVWHDIRPNPPPR